MSKEIVGFDRPAITLAPGEGRAESSLRRLVIRGQPFYLLRQRGGFADLAYDQGRLLAKEIDAGAFPEIVSTIARGVDLGSEVLSRIAMAVYRCYSDRVLDNIGEEFRAGIEALADGYLEGCEEPRFDRHKVRDALVAIEVGNLVGGLTRIFAIPGARAVRLAIMLPPILAKLAEDDEAKSYLERAGRESKVQRAVCAALQRMTGPSNRYGFACTGFSIPAAAARDGRHIHARNLDADLYNWNLAPVLSLIDETPGRAGWHKYIAFGTAGLIYPGGISGLNEAGIAASLHQLSTTQFESQFFFDRGDIAPFVEQRILREAGSLDDAVDLVRDGKHFAAWTFFCSDVRSGDALRIEINEDKVRVTEAQAAPVVQTNHFLHPDMVERAFDEDDPHFTPTFGKWLETRCRFDAVQEAVARSHGRIDVDWSIERLASSFDWQLEQIRKTQPEPAPALASERAYGRVPRKVYGQLGSIVVGDPQRRAGRDEVWMTTGDVLPAPHSTWSGWAVDWTALEIAPVAERPLRQTRQYGESDRTNWADSLPLYVDARVAVARPRGADGELLQRKATEAEARRNLARSESLLTAAIDKAGQDRIVEVPYHYMRARLRDRLGDHRGAKADWDLLWDIWVRQSGRPWLATTQPPVELRNGPLLHPYEAALVSILSSVTEDRLHGGAGWQGRDQRLAEARELIGELKHTYFGAGNPAHFDLDDWLDLLEEVAEKGGAAVDLPEPDFVTVE